jgi:hypothetical protein
MTVSLNVRILEHSVLFNAKKLEPKYTNILRFCERARMTASYGTRALPTRVCVLCCLARIYVLGECDDNIYKYFGSAGFSL